jgi:hypothetical protein
VSASSRSDEKCGSSRRYFGQRILVAAIRFYQGRLARRGPFRRVRCPFAECESCSAFGLRIATQVATSMPEALCLIRARLRRCDQASYHPSPEGWSWGELFDSPGPERLKERLHKAGESALTVAAILRTAAVLAKARRDGERASRLQIEADNCHPGSSSLLRSSRSNPLRRSWREAAVCVFWWTMILVEIVLLHLPFWFLTLCCCLVLRQFTTSIAQLLWQSERIRQQRRSTRSG